MKTKLELLVAFSLLLAASAWAAKWTIDSFDDAPDPGEPDNYIAEEFSGGLKPVKPDQVTLQGGRLYVRQKFEDPFGDEDPTYQIFQGRPKDAAKNLGKISLEGIPYTTLLKMKIFYSRSASGNDDLETVYFDGKDIFVEGEDPVYINLNGKMEELKPVVLREYKISITSEPSGATVMVGNASKGETPVTFSASSPKTISVVVSKEGYYTVIKPITPAEKQTTQEGILLTARKPLANPVTPFRSKLQTANASRDANALKNLKTEVQQALKDYNSDSKKSIDAVMSKLPANPPKASNESANDYSARQNLWTNTQSKERDALNKEAANYFNELKELSAEIDAAVRDVPEPVVAKKPPPPPPPEDDEDDDDAYYDEEEDEEEFEEEMGRQSKNDYSRYDAVSSATDVFGNTDEYLFWTGMVFAAAAVGTGVVGFLENMEYTKANDAVSEANKKIKDVEREIEIACERESYDDIGKCIADSKRIANLPDGDPNSVNQHGLSVNAIWKLKQYKSTNEKTKDSFNKSRIIWFSSAGLAAAISITLFVW